MRPAATEWSNGSSKRQSRDSAGPSFGLPAFPAEQRLRRHEQNDQRLQHLDEILRDLVGENVDEKAATSERAKEQRTEQHTCGMITAEQRHGNPGEPILRRKALIVTIAIAENFIHRNHSGQRSRNRHSDDNLLADRDAAVLRRK